MTSDASLRDRLAALRSGEIPPEELYGVIHAFGEANFLEAEPDVVALLRHPAAEIRRIAVSVLTFHWRVARHRDELVRLLLSDPDDTVRSTATGGVGFVFRDTRDPIVSQALLERIQDGDRNPAEREAAYAALRDVSSAPKVGQGIGDMKARAEARRQKELQAARSREEFQRRLWLWRDHDDLLSRIDWEFVEGVERTIQDERSDSE